jgi:hypothetical protein
MKFRFTYKLTSQLTLTVTTTVDVLLVRLRLTPDGTRITVRVHVRWSNLVCISFDQLTRMKGGALTQADGCNGTSSPTGPCLTRARDKNLHGLIDGRPFVRANGNTLTLDRQPVATYLELYILSCW